MNEANTLPTPAAIRAEMDQALQRIKGLSISTEHTIADYPIGSRLRGQCKITVEFKPGKGCRPVKQTTDKRGKWCKPHAGIYRAGEILAVFVPPLDGRAGWISVSRRYICLEY